VIVRELNAWYDDGLCFVEAVLPRLEGDIEKLYANLPATSEQLLHPDKYLAGEGAKPVSLTNLAETLGDGWEELESSTLGEFTLQNLLVAGLNDRPLIQRAAANWGGDRWALYGRDDSRLLQVQTVWDSAADAAEFWAALGVSLAARNAQVQNGRDGYALQASVGDSRL
jgi:hypothetical protein